MYRVLVCDDQKDIVQALKIYLQPEGYEIYEAFDGQQALEMVHQANIQLVLMDIMMPKMDGITVLRRAREQGCSLPILLLTAKSEIDDRVAGLDAGADDYLTKPFATKELMARIRAITRRQAEVIPSVLQVGNVSLDCLRFELSTDKGAFRLANKEFQMMEMLMTHPGIRITTEHFMERIWGYDSDAEINVVWVYLSYLRKKLSSLEANVHIRAFRGLGYTLEVLP